jgi:hypothetical protein
MQPVITKEDCVPIVERMAILQALKSSNMSVVSKVFDPNGFKALVSYSSARDD